MAGIPTAVEMATIATSDSAVVYQLTADDVLWTARSAAREGSSEAALVAWTLTQRFVLKAPQSFIATLRSFSQPVNPKWARNGEMCKRGGPFHGKPDCAEAKLEAREWYSTASWDALESRHPGLTDTIAAWARGLIDNPIPNVTNFANKSVATNFIKANRTARIAYKGANYYVIDPGAAKWPTNYVTMVSGNGSIAGYFPSFGNKAGGLVAALVQGAAHWWQGA